MQILARFQKLLLSEDEAPTLLYGMNGERACEDDTISKIESGAIKVIDHEPYFVLAAGSPSKGRELVARSFIHAQRAECLDRMTEAVRIARKPLEDQLDDWDRWSKSFEDMEARSHQTPVWDLSARMKALTLMLEDGVGVFQENDVWKHMRMRTMIVLIAAERSRRSTGRWPKTLAEIDKSLLEKAPIDPFTRKPIRLLEREGRFFCYSVSFNRRDDHTAFPPKRIRKGPYDYGSTGWDPELRRKPAEVKHAAK